MKQNWQYKKLGEVCEIVCGQDYKLVQDDKGRYPIYGSGGKMGFANQYRCTENTIIIGRKGNINNPIFVEEKFWNVDTAFGILPNSSILNPKFFFYFSKNYDFTKHDVSVTIPSLRRKDLLTILLPIPPLSEQERIVAELDLLSGIIEKQKQQLKELDTLAQSIFYSMFGDPISNEKNWELKQISDLYQVKIGPFGSLLHKSDYIQGGIPLVNPIHIIDEKILPDYLLTVSNIKLGELKNYILETNDIILARRGEIGRCAVVKEKDKGLLCGTGSLFIRPKTSDINSTFIIKVLRSVPMIEKLVSLAKGATMLNINCNIIEKLTIPVPPLDLQNDFAEKIEKIEKQKEAINKSLGETQKLFDYIMDKYFG